MPRTQDELVALIEKVIVANELENNIAFAYKFSDPDGVRSGKSGWSFGRSQFDTKNNPLSLKCLSECGFDDTVIKGIVNQSIDISPFNAKLRAAYAVIDRYDAVQFRAVICKAQAVVKKHGIALPYSVCFSLKVRMSPAMIGIAVFKVFLQETVLPIVSALLLTLFTMLMNYLAKKYKVAALADQNNFLFKLAGQGIALAEERAAKLAGGVDRLTGSQKLDIAVGHVLAFAPKVSPQQAQDVVHSVLAMIPGAGATGEAVTLLPQEGGYSIPVPTADEAI